MSRTFKAGDTPLIRATLTKERDGEDVALDLDDAERVKIFMEYQETGDLVADDEVEVTSASQGEVEYQLDMSQVIEPGVYNVEFVAEWEDDQAEIERRKTWPTDGYVEVEAIEAVNRDGELQVLLIEEEVDSFTVHNDLSAGSVTADEGTIDDLESQSFTTGGVNSDNAYSVANFDSIQEAIDQADSDGVTQVNVPEGAYDEIITIPEGMALIGSNPQASIANPSVRINPTSNVGSNDSVVKMERAVIEGIYVRGDDVDGDAISTTNGRCIITNCAVRDHIAINHSHCRVYGCEVNGADITIDGNDNAVFGNADVGEIQDNGTDNYVGLEGTDYDIQVDGNDEQGVINFKTI